MEFFTVDLYGRAINTIKTVVESTWTERYFSGGEFKLVFDNRHELQYLPLDSLVTHQKTKEVMVVENIEHKESATGKNEYTVTGRTLYQVLMENRYVTRKFFGEDPGTHSFSYGLVDANGLGWVEVLRTENFLIARDILKAYLQDGAEWDAEAVENLFVGVSSTCFTSPDGFGIGGGSTGESGGGGGAVSYYNYNFNNMQRLDELIRYILNFDDCSVRTVRPQDGINSFMMLELYKGKERTSTEFSQMSSDLEGITYLESTRRHKDSLFLREGDIFMRIFKPKPDDHAFMRIGGYDISHMNLDWESSWSESLVTNNWNAVAKEYIMRLRSLKRLEIMDVEVSKFTSKKYGTDYDLGDFIMVKGKDRTAQRMQVTEVTTEFSGAGVVTYPTLNLPKDETLTTTPA